MTPVNVTLSLADALKSAEIREPSKARQYIGGHFVAPDEVIAMREWMCECAVSECRTGEDAEDNLASVAAATDLQVLRYVSRRYEGGISAFIQAGPEAEISSA